MASSGATNTDTLAWIGASGGAWSVAANWEDVTSGAAVPATSAPGASNAATIDGASASNGLVVIGGGLSASLQLVAGLTLSGAYSTGVLTLGSLYYGRLGTILLSSAALTLSAGGSLTASSAFCYSGSVTLNQAGVALTVSGSFGMGAPTGQTPVINGLRGGQCAHGWASLTLGAGASLSSGDFSLNYGALAESGAGTLMTVGALALGETPSSLYQNPFEESLYPFQGYATAMISSGARLTATGGLTMDSGSALAVTGAGSALSIGGLTVISAEPITTSAAANDVAATSGGAIVFAQGLTFEQLAALSGAPSSLSVLVDAQSSIEIGAAGGATLGALTIDAGASLVDALTVQINAAVVNQGAIEVSGALTLSGGLSGAGVATIDAHATLTLLGAASSTQSIIFNGVGAALDIGVAGDGASVPVASTIVGFSAGDCILLEGVAAIAAAYNVSTGELMLTSGTTVLESLRLAGDYSGANFVISSVAAGSEVTLQTLCFLGGTRIAVALGDVAVENLGRGDLVRTMEGALKPVRWIGRQTVSRRFSDPLRHWPIRVTAHALAENMPSRDLLLSPDHALLVGGVLIHAGALVNGRTIFRETVVPEHFVYYHVELDDHALILAENTPAETFVDNADRAAFDNWAEHQALFPDGKPLVELDLPRAKAARQIPAALRAMLAARADFLVGAAAA